MTGATRRDALLGFIGSAFGATTLGGCTTPGSANSPPPNPAEPLTIDVHSHIFNGSDLQVESFFDDVQALKAPALKVFGRLFRELAHLAPSGDKELAILDDIARARAAGKPENERQLMVQIRHQHFLTVQRETVAAVDKLRRGPPVGLETQHVDQLRGHAEDLRTSATYEEFRSKRSARPFQLSEIAGGFDFVVRNLQYRYVNTEDYLAEYSSTPGRKIDLMVTHLVDFDWPLGRRKTPTPLATQVLVNERISRLTEGRMHAYVAFCPFKQIAYRKKQTPYEPLQVVKDAILKHGHLGVKLYPPMGFRPYGNTDLPSADYWEGTPRDWRALVSPGEDLRASVDAALAELYDWCIDNDVPIMMHTSNSEYPNTRYPLDVLDPSYWSYLFQQPPGHRNFSKLRVNFGHFGDSLILKLSDTNAKILMGFMRPGISRYADASYFSEILSQTADMKAELVRLLTYSAGPDTVPLAERLMYGTDWHLVLVAGGTRAYLDKFAQVMGDISRTPGVDPKGELVARFFGANAATYLGLRSGGAARARLGAFHGATRPGWMDKVDALPAMG